jgi:hypothetical protein
MHAVYKTKGWEKTSSTHRLRQLSPHALTLESEGKEQLH